MSPMICLNVSTSTILRLFSLAKKIQTISSPDTTFTYDTHFDCKVKETQPRPQGLFPGLGRGGKRPFCVFTF